VGVFLEASFSGYFGAVEPTDIPENRPRPDRPGVGASAGGFLGASPGFAPHTIEVSVYAAGGT
jgi:hypothetical protein